MAEHWLAPWSPGLAPYAIVLRQLIDRHLTAEEFEIVFLKLYLSDETVWPDAVFAVLDRFFADVDAFCPDPVLRQATGGIDAGELLTSATMAFDTLAKTGRL